MFNLCHLLTSPSRRASSTLHATHLFRIQLPIPHVLILCLLVMSLTMRPHIGHAQSRSEVVANLGRITDERKAIFSPDSNILATHNPASVTSVEVADR